MSQNFAERNKHWLIISFWIVLIALTFISAVLTGDQEETEAPRALPPIDVTVAKDGSGDYTTVQKAVDAAPANSEQPYVIYIKRGVYKEKVVVAEEKTNLHFIGEDREKTIITYDDYAGIVREGKVLSNTEIPTVAVWANDFRAENMTFQTSAGTIAQALAMYVNGDRAVFEDVSFLGWQDTLRTEGYNKRSYFKDCYIEGHVDYIYGSGTAVFEDCTIFSKAGGYITAASTSSASDFGFVFINCELTGVADKGSVYLGRPWKYYAAVAFINTKMDDIIKPEGWHNWGEPGKESTARYLEFNSTGDGAAPDKRMSWSKQLSEEEAAKYTAVNVLAGKDGWNPTAANNE